MKITQCINGHYYDQEKYRICPFCKTEPLPEDDGLSWDAWDSQGRLRVTLEDGQCYLLRNQLGKGSMAKVYEVTYEESYALKLIRCSNSQTLHRARHEAKMLRSLPDNKNIIAMRHYEEQELDEILYAMMLMEKAKVLSLDEPMEWGMAAAMTRDICKALIGLEEEGILHLDIKIENIFLGNDGRWKLGDFSHAYTLSELEKVTEPVGAFAYMAPEIANECRFEKTADIYSLGIVMYRCFGGGPFPFFKLSSRRKPEDILSSDSIPREILDVINKAAAYRTEDRYQDAKELLNAFETAWEIFRNKYGKKIPREEPVNPSANSVQMLKRVEKNAEFRSHLWSRRPPLASPVFDMQSPETTPVWGEQDDSETVL